MESPARHHCARAARHTHLAAAAQLQQQPSGTLADTVQPRLERRSTITTQNNACGQPAARSHCCTTSHHSPVHLTATYANERASERARARVMLMSMYVCVCVSMQQQQSTAAHTKPQQAHRNGDDDDDDGCSCSRSDATPQRVCVCDLAHRTSGIATHTHTLTHAVRIGKGAASARGSAEIAERELVSVAGLAVLLYALAGSGRTGGISTNNVLPL